MTSAQSIRDQIQVLRAFEPEKTEQIAKLQVELKEANAAARIHRAERKAVLAGILTATHVRLRDGWVEVIRVDAPKHEVVVANGENRQERVGVARVLEVRSL